jgi:DNA-binding phage protein
MALSRTFKQNVRARAQTDDDYRHRMLSEAVETLIAGDMETAKSLLQLYVNATVGFQELGRAMEMAPQSLTRMLGSEGNPRANNLCTMLEFLQREAGIELIVEVRPRGEGEDRAAYADADGEATPSGADSPASE